jgi:hypothetical protein
MRAGNTGYPHKPRSLIAKITLTSVVFPSFFSVFQKTNRKEHLSFPPPAPFPPKRAEEAN